MQRVGVVRKIVDREGKTRGGRMGLFFLTFSLHRFRPWHDVRFAYFWPHGPRTFLPTLALGPFPMHRHRSRRYHNYLSIIVSAQPTQLQSPLVVTAFVYERIVVLSDVLHMYTSLSAAGQPTPIHEREFLRTLDSPPAWPTPVHQSWFAVLKSTNPSWTRADMVFSPSRTHTRGSKYFLLGLSSPSGFPTCDMI